MPFAKSSRFDRRLSPPLPEHWLSTSRLSEPERSAECTPVDNLTIVLPSCPRARFQSPRLTDGRQGVMPSIVRRFSVGFKMRARVASSKHVPPRRPCRFSVCFETSRNPRNRGAARSHQFSEIYMDFESVLLRAKGGWKETVGVWRPISRGWPVSEGRTVPANPFGT